MKLRIHPLVGIASTFIQMGCMGYCLWHWMLYWGATKEFAAVAISVTALLSGFLASFTEKE